LPLPGDRATDVAAAFINGSGDLEVIAWEDTTKNWSEWAALRLTLRTGLNPSVSPSRAWMRTDASLDYSGDVAADTWTIGGSAGVSREKENISGGDHTITEIAIARLSSTRVALAFGGGASI
jgi:hypothetical protein